MNYILLDKACDKKNRTKIKVDKWIGIANAKRYHEYMITWHDFRKEMMKQLVQAEEAQAKQFHMYLLNCFWVTDAKEEEVFYDEFEQKLERVRKAFQ
jgi:hypothetical protein